MNIIKLKTMPTTEELHALTGDFYSVEKAQILLMRIPAKAASKYFLAFYRSKSAFGKLSSLEIDYSVRSKIAAAGFNDVEFMPVAETLKTIKLYQKRAGNFKAAVRSLGFKNGKIVALTDAKRACELGVELELEKNVSSKDDRTELSITDSLIHDIGFDGSLYNGNEIRFKHPKMRGWNIDNIKKILDECVRQNFGDYFGTAGMHVHVSGTNADKAARHATNHWDELCTVLYPVSGRHRYVKRPDDRLPREGHYGRRDNIVKNQCSDFGTLEFRAFSATTNPDVFYWRLIVCEALFKHLAKEKPVFEFMTTMSDKVKEAYKNLLTHDTNPHEMGLPVDVVLKWIGE